MSFVRLGATLVNLDCINAQLVAERTTQLIAVSDHSSGKFLLALSRTITISAIEAAPSPRSRSAKRNPGPFAPSDNRRILIPGVDHLHHAGFFLSRPAKWPLICVTGVGTVEARRRHYVTGTPGFFGATIDDEGSVRRTLRF